MSHLDTWVIAKVVQHYIYSFLSTCTRWGPLWNKTWDCIPGLRGLYWLNLSYESCRHSQVKVGGFHSHGGTPKMMIYNGTSHLNG